MNWLDSNEPGYEFACTWMNSVSRPRTRIRGATDAVHS
ncbi:hypothetical protein SLEP1_g55095 [Rubroshorea leprosula]|uniref:Uncharacterized protein n=1 Tax=Rubroshorea leprosula TaxID=152421 RepID=A0AAV5MHD4_9ROSI|nr:hypothetical protein SLEP1_g55095 [Rubroshorea leprosula]